MLPKESTHLRNSGFCMSCGFNTFHFSVITSFWFHASSSKTMPETYDMQGRRVYSQATFCVGADTKNDRRIRCEYGRHDQSSSMNKSCYEVQFRQRPQESWFWRQIGRIRQSCTDRIKSSNCNQNCNSIVIESAAAARGRTLNVVCAAAVF